MREERDCNPAPPQVVNTPEATEVTDASDRTFRLGDRVMRRVGGTQTGDVVGVSLTINSEPDERICIGWADGTKSFELPIELRLAGDN